MKRKIFTATMAAACFLFASAVNAGTKVNGTLNLGSSKNVTWYLPSGTPNAWVYLQHGYSRSRSNLDDLATDMMNAGLMVLTVDNGVTNGGSSEATKAANAIVDTTITPPSGYALPSKLILSGHSAGGLHATYMAGQLVTRNFGKLAGLVLLEPVDDSNAMLSRMQSVVNKGVKVYAYLANPGQCNKSNNALTPLKKLTPNFVGVQAIDGSTHNDAEGNSGGGGFSGMCGSATAFNIDLVHEFAVAWAVDIANGATTAGYYPGGSRLTSLINANGMKLLKPYSAPVCGNGVIEAGETCDGDACCDAACKMRPSGYVCRASSSACDLSEQCNGAVSTCPADVSATNGAACATGRQCWDGQCIPSPSCGNGKVENGEECDAGPCCTSDCRIKDAGTACRASSGDCDLSESCDGLSGSCPADGKKTDATVCSSGICQAGICSAIPLGWSTALSQTGLAGSSGTFKYYQFQAPAGVTEVQVKIAGSSGNADLYVKKNTAVSTTVYDCRPFLSGSSETCALSGPGIYYVLIKATAAYSNLSLTGRWNYPGAVCGNSILEAGEQCDSGACCKVDCTFAGSSMVCRNAAGPCDVAERCTGSSNDCPTDQFLGATSQCRAVSTICDVAEFCAGGATACPVDGYTPNGTNCGTNNMSCQAGSCVAGPVCGNGKIESGEQCDGGACCNANCTFKSSGILCRSAVNACDAAELCKGSTEVCPVDAKLPDGATCGTAMTCSLGDCIKAPPPPVAGWIVEVKESGLSASANNLKYYTFTVPPSGTDVRVELTYVSGSGDADLYVKKDASVSTSAYDCRPNKRTTTTETCALAGPGNFNIMIKAYSAYTGLNLIGKWYRTGSACGNGVVDSGEQCDGGDCCSSSCLFKAATTVCRADAGDCDLGETCTGATATCPNNAYEANGTTCNSGTCQDGTCKSSGGGWF